MKPNGRSEDLSREGRGCAKNHSPLCKPCPPHLRHLLPSPQMYSLLGWLRENGAAEVQKAERKMAKVGQSVDVLPPFWGGCGL